MENIKISIKSDLSLTPGSRYIKEGNYSGEYFRKKILEPKFREALEKNMHLEIDLDGTFGYGTSFLEEAFGGLARTFKTVDLNNFLILISEEEPYLIDDIKKYIKEATNGN